MDRNLMRRKKFCYQKFLPLKSLCPEICTLQNENMLLPFNQSYSIEIMTQKLPDKLIKNCLLILDVRSILS